MTALRALIVQGLQGLVRERTVAVMAALFVVLVLVSA